MFSQLSPEVLNEIQTANRRFMRAQTERHLMDLRHELQNEGRFGDASLISGLQSENAIAVRTFRECVYLLKNVPTEHTVQIVGDLLSRALRAIE